MANNRLSKSQAVAIIEAQYAEGLINFSTRRSAIKAVSKLMYNGNCLTERGRWEILTSGYGMEIKG
jgi:hypothetical protein